MPKKMPTDKDIEELLLFLPLFDRPDREFVKHWGGGEKMGNGTITMPYPIYDEDVYELFALAGQACWMDHDYYPETAGKMLEDPDVISHADIQSIRTMLTYCVRGERFCDGLWGAVLKSGQMGALLRRLQQLQTASGVA